MRIRVSIVDSSDCNLESYFFDSIDDAVEKARELAKRVEEILEKIPTLYLSIRIEWE